MRFVPITILALMAATMAAPGRAEAQTDPRIGLAPGNKDAGEAARGLELIGHGDKPAGFFNPNDPGDFGFLNSDLAFDGRFVIQGSFHGFQIWDLSDPRSPKLRLTLPCPGGQGDPSVFKNLLFISVEETRGRVDCGPQGIKDSVSAERFRGVRIYDISDIDHPKQVAAVQTCRGSHTHTLVTDPKDAANVYIYVSGTSVVRSGNELAGCSGLPPEKDPNTSLFRIEVIKVPVARPQEAKVIGSPRIFADAAGNVAGLWKGGTQGPGSQDANVTDQCHDITVYTALGLAAGACSGNGLLLDISDPANPKRIADASDPNFAYWHSATFSNDGKKVIFTDEWGGGMGAKCRASDRPQWGADAIYTIADGKLTPAGYYKLPAVQTDQENCVAHNGSLIPVPGRDIMVQAWYQGGVSVFDFTDPAHPVEIAFFDRGPMSPKDLLLGGQWSVYWHNGLIYGSEIGRGLDVLQLLPSRYISKNEIEAAKLVRYEQENIQNQQKAVWPASFVVARAYLDQLERADALRKGWVNSVRASLAGAEKLAGAQRKDALAKLAIRLDRDAEGASDATRVNALAATVRRLAGR